MKRPIPVQFNLQDVKTLIHCKAQLDAVIAALGASNWQGGRTAIAALGIVDQAVCDWFNRVEPHWVKYLNRASAAGPRHLRRALTRHLPKEALPSQSTKKGRANPCRTLTR